MLITPRTYRLSQTPNSGVPLSPENHPTFRTLRGWSIPSAEIRRAAEMLLIHQVGSVKVGEVARYTLTYTPSVDRILPTPAQLYVKIRNTSSTPLRAAYLQGPYALHVSCRPASFDPNHKFEQHETEGLPQFEPNLKPGGAWDAIIAIPESVRSPSASSSAASRVTPGSAPSVTWILDISSEIIFSSTASVHYEVLVGRESAAVELGAPTLSNLPPAGQLHDHARDRRRSKPTSKTPGVYSESIKLTVDDTTSLWNQPPFPSSIDEDLSRKENKPLEETQGPKRRKKIHFVVLTHGLHGNLSADMLYLKESIDAAAKHSREEARKRNQQKQNKVSAEENMPGPSKVGPGSTDINMEHPEQDDDGDGDGDDDDDEEVIVRGFPGNVMRTERGIQYLGKRLAKYVQLMTYPDQPYLPVRSRSKLQRSEARKVADEHARRSSQKEYAYKITSISFIGHSLGGLVQTYAIAYIQKHCPEFFDYIRPVNFVAFASPLLGLSSENPMYVKFALDFGFVGRTGQDLGLSWNAPSRVRSGWEAMVGGLGSDNGKTQTHDPGSKPLLRVLPSGPAHAVLKRFRNRSIYSNVVNDGIVPLRTSCLLFLDWRGLDRVEKARRENGLVSTVAEWGWAQLAGLNSNTMHTGGRATGSSIDEQNQDGNNILTRANNVTSASQSAENSPKLVPVASQQGLQSESDPVVASPKGSSFLSSPTSPGSPSGPVNSFFSFFRPQKKEKGRKIYRRSQTLRVVTGSETDTPINNSDLPSEVTTKGPVRNNSLLENEDSWFAPPRTSILESAGDVLAPPLPSTEYLLDPSSRPRTIFHDRVYHPDDIPPPPPVRPRTIFRTSSTNVSRSASGDFSSQQAENSNFDKTSPGKSASDIPQKGSSGMKVEEKIARAYHRDLTWRKILVRLEPDAHNNIIVRRMFANANGWPVVKHFVDAHFGYTASARESDDQESRDERAKPMNVPATDEGEEVIGQHDLPHHRHAHRILPHIITHTTSSNSENDVCLQTSPTNATPLMLSPQLSPNKPARALRHSMSNLSVNSRNSLTDSAKWTDSYFEDDGRDEESADEDTDHLKEHDGIRTSRHLESGTHESSDPETPTLSSP